MAPHPDDVVADDPAGFGPAASLLPLSQDCLFHLTTRVVSLGEYSMCQVSALLFILQGRKVGIGNGALATGDFLCSLDIS